MGGLAYLGQGGEQEDPVGERLGPGQLDGTGDLLDGLQHDLLGARLHRGCRRRRQGDRAAPARPQPADGCGGGAGGRARRARAVVVAARQRGEVQRHGGRRGGGLGRHGRHCRRRELVGRAGGLGARDWRGESSGLVWGGPRGWWRRGLTATCTVGRGGRNRRSGRPVRCLRAFVAHARTVVLVLTASATNPRDATRLAAAVSPCPCGSRSGREKTRPWEGEG